MRCLLLALVLLLPCLSTAGAQPDSAERIAAAEASFTSGLAEFRRGGYDEAFRRFIRAATASGYNERTTAATFMAGRAALAAGRDDLAASTFTTLLREYPRSRYAAEAEALRAQALGGPPPAGDGDPFDLGIVLPLAGQDALLAQAIFNGIRLAVDEHNVVAAAGRVRPVRMVFRASGAAPDAARAAVVQALSAGVEAVIGPLYSEEALAAADLAEREGLVLLAPLATDDAVAAGRRFVFQANPTFALRGRALAAFAATRLGGRRLGTVAQAGTYGATMADAFENEARGLGATIALSERLPDAAAWDRLADVLEPNALDGAEAVYFPATGADAPEHVADVLRTLEELDSDVLPLGNLEWEDLEASRERAGTFRAVFETDFFVEPQTATAFSARYRALSGIEPDRLAIIGYDATRFLLARLPAVAAGTSLADAIRAAPRFRGLGHRFHFDGGQVNRALFIKGYREGDTELLE